MRNVFIIAINDKHAHVHSDGEHVHADSDSKHAHVHSDGNHVHGHSGGKMFTLTEMVNLFTLTYECGLTTTPSASSTLQSMMMTGLRHTLRGWECNMCARRCVYV